MVSLRTGTRFRLTALLLGIGIGSASASELESFAAQLLCKSQGECAHQPVYKESSPLVISGQTLPADAARNIENEQRYLVQQGAYLNKEGEIVSLSKETVSVIPPDRGDLRSEDYGPADMIPLEGPVIIATPKGAH